MKYLNLEISLVDKETLDKYNKKNGTDYHRLFNIKCGDKTFTANGLIQLGILIDKIKSSLMEI